ncbi:MAG: lipoprotein signal peptidase [Betaproteobacteria bacterium]|nr:lipoprotein signal peptidase [Betaproteobacteria bacterium]
MFERGKPETIVWLSLSAAIVVADQLTKLVVQDALGDSGPIVVTSFFQLVLAFNTGAAFSFLSDQSGWQRHFFMAIAAAASVFIVLLLRKHREEPLFCLALSLILGGAVGNLIDRVLVGAVVDFLYFHIGVYGWPAFNLADMAISCGAVLLIWDAFRKKSQHAQTEI